MSGPRPPWEVIETFPSSDPSLVAEWDSAVADATTDATRVAALTGRALARYWAVQERAVEGTWEEVARRRADDAATAVELARGSGRPDLLATALLGTLYATWGPDTLHDRPPVLTELAELHPHVGDEELRLRIREWTVLEHFDRGDLAGARAEVAAFAREAAGTDLVLFRRREELWRANLAMLTGRIDEAVAINQGAISATATEAGTPFSFQNVAITLAIERFLRRGLDDTVDAVRAIRASSPRVATNWDTGLAFSLAETGQLDEAAEIFDRLATDDFRGVHRDLNWLVTMQLLGLVALHLDDAQRCATLLEHLSPFAELDATHGSGYASYGPVGRVVGSLAARCGDPDRARSAFAHVLSTREPGPWTTLTRLDAARGLATSDPDAAVSWAGAALRQFDELGMPEWIPVARRVVDDLHAQGHGGPMARRDGDHWELRHPAGVARIPHGKGVQLLVELLARPGEALGAAALEGGQDPTSDPSAAEASLDPAARRAYRARLEELEVQDARGALDAAGRREREFLARELAGALYAPSVSAEDERARVRVTKALRRTITAVAETSSALGEHLSLAVETGRRCSYTPADGVGWRVVDRTRTPEHG